ncbi:hypothetical protein [Pseudomonas fluorescens]|uniref:hypothetical protein n=1 Tax=Pseudomonas fluorescens TaxID=294 RepID=UPI0017853DEA|nr:hypothetical protein [Pseudomonas fluorescens]
MKAYFTIFLLLALTACSTTQEEPKTPTTISRQVSSAPTLQTTHATKGAEAVVQLTRWYNRTDEYCGPATRPTPSFLCSGVMIRATETNPQFLPWDPSPGSIASGGVSFSWLRKDNGFNKMVFGYNNGLIFYPSFDTPPGKNDDIQTLCAFPYDGATNSRPQQGCGAHPRFPTNSRPCNVQGIDTAQLWIARFNAAQNKYEDQCGWNVREGQSDSANRFYQNILARGLMQPAHWAVQNELRLATWPTGSGATLPIQSFFYLTGSNGLNNARNDQSRYYQKYEQFVPIIRVTLPANKGDTASFAYNESDQGTIPAPGTITFTDVPLAEGMKELVQPTATFKTSKKFAIKEKGTILTGHYLAIGDDNDNSDSVGLFVTPAASVRSISLDIAVTDFQSGRSGVQVDYVEGGIDFIEFTAPQAHYTFTSSPGKTIKEILFIVQRMDTMGLDNINFY